MKSLALSSLVNLCRSIVALFLAFLMGSPLCCCASESHPTAAQDSTPSCCQHPSPSQGKGHPSTPTEHVCACKSKDPRDLEKAVDLPSYQALALLPAPSPESLEPTPRILGSLLSPPPPENSAPRRRLAWLSRWLI
ncbi:hypothetical protein HNR46_004042 [Haloferula luteola]|uniref:Uncharacterized protein n=1 Tax=Haloferula luteola TaxID=595692 RepID=A0A840VIU5_9BACT|nr:hypothetical protein [Haloferula luteola]MBB5353780.1 hypothetical protein [Haloferula luteola]